MSAIYKASEWQGASGKWYCNSVQDLAGIAGKWWIPAKILKISLVDYILLLKDKYNATIVSYELNNDILIFYWNNYSDCHKFLLYINSIARKTNFLI